MATPALEQLQHQTLADKLIPEVLVQYNVTVLVVAQLEQRLLIQQATVILVREQHHLQMLVVKLIREVLAQYNVMVLVVERQDLRQQTQDAHIPYPGQLQMDLRHQHLVPMVQQ